MRAEPGPVLEETESPAVELRLLIAPEPGFSAFVQNLRDLVRPSEVSPLRLQSTPAAFWPDVFVESRLPLRRFFESGIYHVLALGLIWAGVRFLALQPHAIPQAAFTHADVIYPSLSEYLPPLDTRRRSSAHAQKADPEFSAQPIISVPRDADNRSQTIVTPPSVQLQDDVALPNTVAWSDNPRMPIAPAPVVRASEISRLAPRMERSVIAPPAVLDAGETSQKTMQAPQPSVIAPPPAVDAASNRRIGEINIGHSSVIAPAPQLALNEQHTISGGRSGAARGHSPQVIAPPPSVNSSGGSRSSGGMIALSLHPAVGAPPASLAGNRRGNFAATPEGHRGASGAPGSSGASATANGSSASSVSNLPAGLYVGKSSSANSVNPNLIANAPAPRVSRGPQAANESKISEAERAVFGERKIYSLSLNMPNLNSAGGSWIIRFAALKADSAPVNSSASEPAASEASSSNLSSPVATRKVDPAYPLELMKQNVGGTVILYGVIHANGTVGNVRVLRSVDDRLDRFASDAIAKWQFRPATNNGSPVDVEATFLIPFRPTKTNSNF